MKIIEPALEELDKYFEMRWRILREPLGLPRGSERDSLEDVSVHAVAIDDAGEYLGVAKYKPYSEKVAQISHVAVEESCRGKGVGRKLVHYLEGRARNHNYTDVFLTAREYNIPYFEKLGYVLGKEPKENPLPNIKIFEMHKSLVQGKDRF